MKKESVNRVELRGLIERGASQTGSRAPVKFTVKTGNDTKSDGTRTPTLYHKIAVWDRPDLLETAREGVCARIMGKLHYPQWTDQSGVKHSDVEIIASAVELVPRQTSLELSAQPDTTAAPEPAGISRTGKEERAEKLLAASRVAKGKPKPFV